MQPQIRQARVLAPANQAAPSKKPLPFFAPGRVDILTPSHSIRLAEENKVLLQTHAPGLTAVIIEQVKYDPDDMVTRTRPRFLKGGSASVPVLHQQNGRASIMVTPRALGQVVLQIHAQFADGGFTNSEMVLNVQPSGEIPERLVVGAWGAPSSQARWVTVFLDPKKPARGLTINAFYKNVEDDVEIDPTFASFEVRTANSLPVISMDKATGAIKPLREGDALVETIFGGWTNLTCIVVRDHFDPNPRNTFDCKSLLRPGEQIGRSIRK
ncbi:hypothetical protein [Terriglobus albidus]|uniref:hypothetical protein n=1 Tax=Terriglobus albidus TaxID=1592106 RepID=UPI0021E08A33|nr:hypothetical protein [Terriglobus albidus]